MSRTNNLLTGIAECVMYCTTVEMVNGSSGRKGTVMEAWTAHEEFCQAGHRRDGDGYRASDSVYGTTCVPLSLLSSNTQLEKVKKFAYTDWTKYVVNPETIMYNKCTGTIDIGKILEELQGSWL